MISVVGFVDVDATDRSQRQLDSECSGSSDPEHSLLFLYFQTYKDILMASIANDTNGRRRRRGQPWGQHHRRRQRAYLDAGWASAAAVEHDSVEVEHYLHRHRRYSGRPMLPGPTFSGLEAMEMHAA